MINNQGVWCGVDQMCACTKPMSIHHQHRYHSQASHRLNLTTITVDVPVPVVAVVVVAQRDASINIKQYYGKYIDDVDRLTDGFSCNRFRFAITIHNDASGRSGSL